MDEKLVAWARAVKSRQRRNGVVVGAPVLWLFTDARRLADPLAAAARLPRHLGGVVLRHDGAPGRAALGRALAALCRARGLALSVAGDWRLAAALGAGLHLRSGRRPAGAPRTLRAMTSSAHGVADLRRGRREGALAFLSPAFASASHPGAAGLGPCRWGLAARRGGGAAALGGIDGRSVRRLPGCAGAGAIGALGFVALG
jgi:thiamine-phosphate pyrophosphorylase